MRDCDEQGALLENFDGWVKNSYNGNPFPEGKRVNVLLRDGRVWKDRESADLVWDASCHEDTQIESYLVLPTERKQSLFPKQERYQDDNGEDWIDECARTLTPGEFRGAMKFTIGKYVRRTGKKDAILKEVKKIADYAQRWEAYENTEGRQDDRESDAKVRY